jgi:hypothetical protein
MIRPQIPTIPVAKATGTPMKARPTMVPKLRKPIRSGSIILDPRFFLSFYPVRKPTIYGGDDKNK